jgi:hypothetical protein
VLSVTVSVITSTAFSFFSAIADYILYSGCFQKI